MAALNHLIRDAESQRAHPQNQWVRLPVPATLAGMLGV
jgi:hypothetical protein